MTREVQDLYFDLNSHVLRAREWHKVAQMAPSLQDVLHHFPELIIVVEGYSDGRGLHEYNRQLALERADAFRRVLLRLGFPEDRVRAVSFGDYAPQCLTSDEACRQKNRRVHFRAAEAISDVRAGKQEMFKIVTVAREYGSGGGIIARTVAEKLGWTLLDGALIRAVARTAEVNTESAGRYDEQVDSWWHRFNRAGLRSAAIWAGIPPGDVQFFDADAVATLTQQVMLKAAATGDCVIVGRGAQCVLQDHEEVLHVLICAPWAERVGRVRARAQLSWDVEELMRATDHERASYIRTYYGCDWKDPHLYHMMISSQIGIEIAAWMIVNAVKGVGQP